ncbi:MAG TPA: hypothetical protein VHL09_06385, partial [Dehalococcoidia bacterium]|nr:hypothetical protein [Dehalococcoidia bacterium]
MIETGHEPVPDVSQVHFGQPFDTARPARKSYPLIEDQPLPSEALLQTELTRPVVDRFLRSHHTRLDKWDLMSYVDLDPAVIDVDLLSDQDVDVLESALKVEANNPVYVRKLLDHLKGDVQASNFVVIWGYEEFKHYYAIQAYLAKVWAIRFLREKTGRSGPFG